MYKNIFVAWLLCGLISAGSFLVHLKKHEPDLYADNFGRISSLIMVVALGPIGLGMRLQAVYEETRP